MIISNKNILWAFITIINLQKAKLMEKQAKRERKLAEKKAKRIAKEGSKKDEPKEKTLDTSKPITLDFLTNPDKE